MSANDKPLILITGMAGKIGSSLASALQHDYQLVGLDRSAAADAGNEVRIDLGSQESVRQAMQEVRQRYGERIAAVIHLAAYFDFTGEESPLYEKVNVNGTRYLLQALQDFQVERFIYASTMLVQKATTPGKRIDEATPLAPGWAYPQSKAKAEDMIRQHHGRMPYLIFRLAGLYDDCTVVPTLAQQIARIYERNLKSHLYAGDQDAGQSFLHQEDMVELFVRAIERRKELPEDAVILAGEEEAVSYARLQKTIGGLIHGEAQWETLNVPEPLAKTGAWLQEKTEPLVPDALDQGEKPFIRPFMIDLAADHYALDIGRARILLGWEPRHFILDVLPTIITGLKKDANAWYQANKISPPDWMQAATGKTDNPETLRVRYEQQYREAHHHNLWAHFINMGLGAWLLTSPAILGYSGPLMTSDLACGVLVMLMAFMALSWRFSLARFGVATIGCWVLLAPLVFPVPGAAAYLNGTLVGGLLIGFAIALPPAPGISPAAAMSGPSIPPGWTYSPSSWFQRMLIIIMAFVGFFISRHLAAYQLGHLNGIWEPFFEGAIASDGKNGSEEITTSWVSEAWPVPDAGLGAFTYMLEIITGLMGSTRRWRTMPWLVLLFGLMIVPLGVVSITFIIIQPILLDTWCTLCLIAAAAMLVQIPYSFDELVASIQFLLRRRAAGRPLLRILFTGDTDEGEDKEVVQDNLQQKPAAIIREMLGGGISVPWNLLACIAIGIWLMCTRLTLNATGGMADADHLIGALLVTVSVCALAEVARMLRFLNVALGIALLAAPFLYSGPAPASTAAAGIVCGLAVILLSLPRGTITSSYGTWDKYIR